ncbi:MAG: TolC family protein [Candidatus Eremiobacteraeota bacterium]|nr:TolC family protein [Candidatus Eremiobacteraeota bacterium]
MREVLMLSLSFSMLLSTPALADPLTYNGPLTMNQAVARARDAGFDVRLLQADAETAKAQARSARAQTLPQIGVSGTVLKADLPQLGMPVARQTYFSANASVPILAASQLFSAQAAAIAGAGSEISVGEARNDAAYEIIQIYHRVQLADALIGARTIGLQAQQNHLQTTKLRVAAGKSPRYLLARDRAALAGAEQDLEDASAQRDQALNDLKAALDYNLDSKIHVTDTLRVEPFDLTRDAALTRSQELRPAVAAARRQLDAAQTRVRAVRAQYIPTITGSAQTYSGSSSPALGHTGYQVGVSANLPIVDGGTRSAGIAQAVAEVHRTQTRYEQLRLFAQRDVLNAYRELQAASTNLQTSRSARANTQEQLRIAQLREASGKGIYLEVLDALTVAANARENVLSAITRYDNAVAGVQHGTGDLSIIK